jgi:replicative DNA helicase
MTKDLDDRGREGSLPKDPALEATRVLRAVKPGARDLIDDAERALLGSCLWAGMYEAVTERAKSVEAIVEPRMFRSESHAATFAALLAVETSGGATEPVAIASEARRAGASVDSAYLTTLADSASAPSPAKLAGWAKTIREAWLCRQAAEFGRLTAANATVGTLSSAELLADARARLEELSSLASGGTATTVSLKDAAREAFAHIGKTSRAMPTGLIDLDREIAGLFPRETSVLAARTSVGKTSLAATIARNIVRRHERTAALYISLEMGHSAFAARLIADHAGVPAKKIRHSSMTADEMTRFVTAISEVGNTAIEFSTSTVQTLASIAASARALSASLSLKGHRLALIVIDHVGLVKPSAKALEKASREQQVAETSRGLRYLAERFDCHVMALAQIGREAEKDGAAGKMPALHQLRESDSLAQDADLTLILHRERDPKTRVFRTDKPPALAVAKARNDETSIMLLSFEAQYVRFGNHDGETRYGDWY